MKLVTVVLAGLILLRLAMIIVPHWPKLVSQYDAVNELDYYQHSRYFQGDKADYLPSDEQVHAIRGWQFVVKLQDPEETLHDHPLLGTYLIGLSILVFGNPYVFSLFAGLLILVLIGKISQEISGDKTLVLLAVLIVAWEPLFAEQLTASLLDIYLLLFSLGALWGYVRWWRTGKFGDIALAQLCLGLAFATKFFITSMPLFAALYLPTIFSGNFRRFLTQTRALVFTALGFFLGNLTYFFYHPSLVSFARFQRYLLSWWAGTPTIKPGGVWSLVFENRWQTWWGDEAVVAVSGWWFGWPLFISLGLLSLPCLWLARKQSLGTASLYLFLVLNLGLFSLSLVFPRYLVLILPVAVVLSLRLLSGTKKPAIVGGLEHHFVL